MTVKMFRPSVLIISILQMISDVVMVFIGGMISTWLFNRQQFFVQFPKIYIVLFLFMTIASIVNMYSARRTARTSNEIKIILKVSFLTFVISIFILFLFEINESSLLESMTWLLLSLVGILILRILIKYSLGCLRRKGYNTQSVAFIGLTPSSENLIQCFNKETWMGLNVVGYYDDIKHDHPLYKGRIAELLTEAKAGQVDRIYIALPMEQLEGVKSIIAELSDSTCSVMLIPDIFAMGLLSSNVQAIGNVPIVAVFDTPMNGVNRYIKRLEDIVVSSLILLLISPILLILAILVKSTSKGPVIFKQKRYGMNGRMISVWKFRSMNVMENGGEVKQAQKDDPRLTSIGGFLRKTSLDELPQFINVLLGDMSIVGPRPHAIVHNEHYRKLIQGYMLRHKVKPGITGLAQVNGWRGETDTLEKMEKRVEYDLAYIRNWSLWLDLKIIFLTIFKGFVNKSAY